jgi:hypothetical protein
MRLRDLANEVGGLASDAVMGGVTRLTAGGIAREEETPSRPDARSPRPPGAETPPAESRTSRADDLSRSLARAAGRAQRVPRAGGEVAGRAVNAVVSVIDLNAVLDRVDVQAIVDRVDVQSVVDRVDVDQVIERVDVDRVVESLDPNRLVSRIDIDAVVDRIDVAEVTADALDAIDIGGVIRESSSTIGTDAIEGARYQAMAADDLLARTVDRLLGRSTPRRTTLDRREP